MGVTEGLEIHHDGDLPARSGLGSSSSFTVGLLNALHAFRGQMASKGQLAGEAIRIEQEVIGEAVGSQDQMWAAYGGLNRIDFNMDGSIDVTPLVMDHERRERLQSHLVLYFTGLSRYAPDIEQEKIANLGKHKVELRAMRTLVDEAESINGNPQRDLNDLDRLLHEGWMLKRALSPNVSSAMIDTLYETALGAGALGGKLLGGGFLLLFVPPERQVALRERLKDLTAVKFRFDNGGSKVVVYQPDDFGLRAKERL
ncbi:kinase [Azospirillum sp. C340-1]|uniref:Kinase n=2 Tax=Azospirillum isscasi TaxID=3053926 RepID=A0ABU0WMN0_9PROT|nr:kinase [Azospirillum isscasi]